MSEPLPTDIEVADSSEPALPAAGMDRSAVWLTVAEIGIVVVIASVMILFPEPAERLLTRMAGITVALGGLAFGLVALQAPRQYGIAILGLGGIVLGTSLALDPEQRLGSIAVLIGGGLIAWGLWHLIGIASGRQAWHRGVVLAVLCGVAGAALVFFGDQLLDIALWGVAVLLLMHAFVRAGVRFGVTDIEESDDRALLLAWIDAKGKTPQRRKDVYDQIFYEGTTGLARTARFGLMMLFASVISAVGVLTESTAVVIGAMLIAPLISPMMGMGLSLVMGWPNRLGRSAATVLGGVAIAIGTGAFLAAALDLAVDLEANTQITSRSSPRIADLVIAIAAGAAGAYALSRDDVSSSLPGVAIAIALVPPLSVVGIAAQGGDWEQASGTMLLFLTNLVAILLVGGLVFMLTGVAPSQRAAENQYRVRTAAAAVAALGIVVVVGLFTNGQAIAVDSLASDEAGRAVEEWLGPDSDFEMISVDVTDERVAVVLAGPGDPEAPERLLQLLTDALDDDVRLDLQWIPRQRQLLEPS